MLRSNIILIVLMYSILFVTGSSAATVQTLSYQDATLGNDDFDYVYQIDNQESGIEEFGPLVYDKLFFQQLAAVFNEATPFDTGFGIEISRVSMYGNSINFYITCDYLTCLCLDLAGEDNAESVKYEMALALNGLFDDMGHDDNGDGIVAKMESLGLELNYYFYVDEFQDAIMSFKITGDYITRAVDNNNGLYTI